MKQTAKKRNIEEPSSESSKKLKIFLEQVETFIKRWTKDSPSQYNVLNNFLNINNFTSMEEWLFKIQEPEFTAFLKEQQPFKQVFQYLSLVDVETLDAYVYWIEDGECLRNDLIENAKELEIGISSLNIPISSIFFSTKLMKFFVISCLFPRMEVKAMETYFNAPKSAYFDEDGGVTFGEDCHWLIRAIVLQFSKPLLLAEMGHCYLGIEERYPSLELIYQSCFENALNRIFNSEGKTMIISQHNVEGNNIFETRITINEKEFKIRHYVFLSPLGSVHSRIGGEYHMNEIQQDREKDCFHIFWIGRQYLYPDYIHPNVSNAMVVYHDVCAFKDVTLIRNEDYRTEVVGGYFARCSFHKSSGIIQLDATSLNKDEIQEWTTEQVHKLLHDEKGFQLTCFEFDKLDGKSLFELVEKLAKNELYRKRTRNERIIKGMRWLLKKNILCSSSQLFVTKLFDTMLEFSV